jgi:eukaryotic-like serine/threonine-protein kinase
MEPSVEDFCNLLVRGRLLPPLQVRNLRKRWQAESAGGAATLESFSKWLVAHGCLTAYQAGLLQRGKADHIVLNDYKILDRVGQGRMAAVYKAVHANGQIVALKVLPPSKARCPESFARFQREARLALQLKHPNVIRTFQAGQCDVLHYIVMEYVEGEALEEVLRRRKRLPAEEAVRIIHQALLGLQHIHELGMVHRDLEPSNLMLVSGAAARGTDSTLQATVKILDIGLGRALFDEGAVPLTKISGMPDGPIGTSEYLAPEQARDPHAADIRADIYSLGCILYRCLTGRPPFVAETGVQLMVLHATEALTLPRDLNPALPEAVEDVVVQMLQKDPALRFPTPADAAGALLPFVPGGEDFVMEESSVEMLVPSGDGLEESAPAPAAGKPDVELVPVAVPVSAEPRRSASWLRRHWQLALGYGLGVGSVLVLELVGWKLLFLVVLAALMWRFRGLLWLKLQQLLAPGVPTASVAPVATIVQPTAAEPAAKGPPMVAQLK